jgi:hypothetical protein
MVYSGLVDPELEEDFTHRVTWTAKPTTGSQYDKWGKPIGDLTTTGIPCLWIGKAQLTQKEPGQNAIAQYIKVLLPHDVLPHIGDKLKNESTNTDLEVRAVTPPIYEDDTSIPCTVYLQ